MPATSIELATQHDRASRVVGVMLLGLLALAPPVCAESPRPDDQGLLVSVEPSQPIYEAEAVYESGELPAAFADDIWTWQVLPEGLIYHSYLASTKESRFSAHAFEESNQGWLFDGTLGTRVGLLRYGSHNRFLPEGFQFDAEGAAQLRMDWRDDIDVISVDFRGGAPITFGWGRHRTKFGYYHLSSHVGDEFLIKNSGFNRLNYSRDALLLGHSIFVTDSVRVYAETAWSFRLEVAKPWEFQFGLDYAPSCPTDFRGAPFFAVNAHLREEVNFGGGLTVQTGWAWRSTGGQLFRMGLHYYNGESNQWSFYDDPEQQIGIGFWYDN